MPRSVLVLGQNKPEDGVPVIRLADVLFEEGIERLVLVGIGWQRQGRQEISIGEQR